VAEFVSVHVDAQQPGIATLLLSRPPSNALTRQMYRELGDAARELGHRDDVCAVILFGGHEIFSAGDDVDELRTLDAAEAEAAARACRDAVDVLAALPRPTVAAVTGYALGGGLAVALAADWRVSGDNAKFGATEVRSGFAPRAGTARLAEAIGVSKAKNLVFSGRFVDAREALAVGLIDEMVAPDGVYDAAVAWAGRFAECSPQVLAAAKATFSGG